MEIASQEDHDIPIPLNTAFGNDVDDDDNDSASSHDHIIHHNNHHQATNSTLSTHNNNITSTITHPTPISSVHHHHQHQKHHEDHHHHYHHQHQKNHEDHHHHNVGYNMNINVKNKKKKPMIKYKECLKNHAAAMGGNAIDGCGEFMPSGEENSIEALICSACNCHRNFHRKEIQPQNLIHKIKPQQMIMPIGVSNYNYIQNLDQTNHLSEENALNAASKQPQTFPYNQKKRFRTKFSQEQKEKMLRFAEKIEWKLQREEDFVVKRFCEEIGVRRKVLKVWMHNNKRNHFSKNNNINLEDDNKIN